MTCKLNYIGSLRYLNISLYKNKIKVMKLVMQINHNKYFIYFLANNSSIVTLNRCSTDQHLKYFKLIGNRRKKIKSFRF